MPESLLTPRDCKAIERLLEQAIEKLPDKPELAELWAGVLRRFRGDVSARPQSIAPSIIALLSAARSANLMEVDLIGRRLVDGLVRHGDLEGSNALRRVVDAIYEQPLPPPKGAKGAPRGPAPGPSPSPPADGSAPPASGSGPREPPREPPGGRPKKPAGMATNEHVRWFPPEDMSEAMVLDETTGPALRRLVAELKARKALIDVDIDAPTRIVFHGPPGTGKTLGACWVGGCLEMPVAAAKIGGMLSCYLGETTRNLMQVIDGAVKEGAIVFLDEIESVSGNRAGGPNGAHDEYKRLTGALLQCLDQLPRDQIVIAATNFRNKLDGALLERLGYEVAFAFPDEVARTAQVNRLWRMVKADPTAKAFLVQATAGKSGRFIRWAAMSSARAAVIDASGDAAIGTVQVEKAVIELKHVEPAIAQAKRAEEEADAEEKATSGTSRSKRPDAGASKDAS